MSEISIRSARGEAELQAVRQFCKDAVSWEIETFPEHRAAIVAHFQPQTLDSRLAKLPEQYVQPTGDMLLAWHRDAPVGTVMFRILDEPPVAEMARLYVATEARGMGCGAQLVNEVVERARAGGARRLRFVTARHLTSAIRLYEAMGFAPTESWREIDPATAQQILFMQRAL